MVSSTTPVILEISGIERHSPSNRWHRLHRGQCLVQRLGQIFHAALELSHRVFPGSLLICTSTEGLFLEVSDDFITELKEKIAETTAEDGSAVDPEADIQAQAKAEEAEAEQKAANQ